MNPVQKFEVFPWFEDAYMKLQKSFTFRNEEDVKSALEAFIDATKLEIRSIVKERDTNRAEALLSVTKDCLLHLHFQNMLHKEDFQGRKYLYLNILSHFLDLCIYLSDSPDSVHLSCACQQLFLLSGSHVISMWDVLLRCSLLKKANMEICCPILRRVLSVSVEEDLEPKQYMKFLLLSRLWKVFTSDISEKERIKNLVTKVKIPDDFLEFLSLFPVPEISAIPASVKKRKIAVYFLCKKFPKDVLKEAKQILCDEIFESVSEVTVPSAVGLSSDVNSDSLFLIDTAGATENDEFSHGCLEEYDVVPKNSRDVDYECFPSSGGSPSHGSKPSYDFVQEHLSDIPAGIESQIGHVDEKSNFGVRDSASLKSEHGNVEVTRAKKKKCKRKEATFSQESFNFDVDDETNPSSSRKQSFQSRNSGDRKLLNVETFTELCNDPSEQQIEASYSESKNNSQRKKQKKSKKRKCSDLEDALNSSENEIKCRSLESCEENKETPQDNEIRSHRKRSKSREKSPRTENDSFCLRLDFSMDDSQNISSGNQGSCRSVKIARPSSNKSPNCVREKADGSNILQSSYEVTINDSVTDELMNVSSISGGVQGLSSKKLSVGTSTRCETWLKECETVSETEKSGDTEVLQGALIRSACSNSSGDRSELAQVHSLLPVSEDDEKKCAVSLKPKSLRKSLRSKIRASKGDVSSKPLADLESENDGADIMLVQNELGSRNAKPTVMEQSPSKNSNFDNKKKSSDSEGEDEKNEGDNQPVDNISANIKTRKTQCRYVKCLYPGQDLPTIKSTPRMRSQRLSKANNDVFENPKTEPNSLNSDTAIASSTRSFSSPKRNDSKDAKTRTPNKLLTNKRVKLEESVSKLVKARSVDVSSPSRQLRSSTFASTSEVDVLSLPLRKSQRIKSNCQTPTKRSPSDIGKTRKSPRKSATPTKFVTSESNQSDSEFYSPDTSDYETASDATSPAKINKITLACHPELEYGLRKTLMVDLSKDNASLTMSANSKGRKHLKINERDCKLKNAKLDEEKNMMGTKSVKPGSQKSPEKISESTRRAFCSPSKGDQKKSEYSPPTLRSPAKKYNLRIRTSKTPWKKE